MPGRLPSARVVAADDHEVVRYPTDEILLRVVGGGEVEVTEYRSEDREGPPPHRHEWDEIEYVIEGEVEFYVDGRWHHATAGAVQVLPAGAAHSVRVPQGSARLLMVTIGRPYAPFAREMGALLASGEVTPTAVGAVAARHGVEVAE